MSNAPQPDQELDRIRTAITAAREKIVLETSFDVAPLAGALEGLCEQIAALPMEAARGYAGPLQATLQLLEALEDDISLAHDEIQQRMVALNGAEMPSEEGIE